MSILTIIPLAGKPTNSIHASYNNLPDGMIPINSKPVIGHILDDLIERGIKDSLLLLNKYDIYTEKYISLRYNNKLNIKFHYVQNNNDGILGSINEGCNSMNINNYSSIFVYLGDTIYKGDLEFEKSFLTISKDFSDSSLWCFIEDEKFINKPNNYTGNGQILTGLYFFNDIKVFLESLSKNKKGEIYNLLEEYSKKQNFELVESEGWYDIGNIENYYKAKIDFLKVRSFNSVVYDDVYGTIKKSSSNKEKIKQEINWYLNMPYELKIFSPRLVNYNLGNDTNYEIEFYGYQSLGDLYLFGYLKDTVWYSIIDKLFFTLDLFKKYTTYQPYSFFYDMYYTKTIQRIAKMKENTYFNELYNHDSLIINGVNYKNIYHFITNLEKYVEILYDSKDITFIHGDFCLSNILYDTSNKIIKMIDPRGYFGELGVYGDIKYDIAKLRHSLVGNYDFIVSDLFKIEEKNNEFIFNIYNEEGHQNISKYFDIKLQEKLGNIENIKFIEALLFLTMIPLHSDNFERQKAMYLIAVEKFNLINFDKLGK
ncbi:MAG: sugar phosphate nucleotidyltransferase [Candidatus Altimarinota bacterium]